MHEICSKSTFNYFSGFNVAFDFLEVPSSFFELWAEDPIILHKISSHYQTNEKIPINEIKEILKGFKTFKSLNTLGIFVKALFDLEVHGNIDYNLDLYSLYKKINQEVNLISIINETHPYASFSHIMTNGPSFFISFFKYKLI
jgi:Zn-dependent oligopeptidase